MKKRKKLFPFFLLFLLLLMGTLFLAYKFVLPVLIEQFLEERLARGLEREVSLEKVDFSLFRGIKLYHLLVLEAGEEGEIFLQIEELQIDYQFAEILDNLREKGTNFQKWQLALKITSPEILFRGWRLENLELPLQIENFQLIGKDLEVELYGGSFKGPFSLNLASEKKDYQFEGTLSGLDLNRLLLELGPPGKKEIRGILEANFSLQGKLNDWKYLSGQGEVKIREGRLGEIPLLKDLTTILPLLSPDKVIFREGRASFTISEGIAATDNLTLIGDQVNLSGQGKIDLQGYFQPSFVYRVSFSKIFLDKVPLLGNIISTLLDEAGYLMAQVEVTGSLKEPKSRLIPLAKGLRNILRMFSAPLQDGM